MTTVQLWWVLSGLLISSLALTEQFGALPGALAACAAAGYLVVMCADPG